MIEKIPKEEILTAADIGCGEGSNLLYLHRRFPNANLFGFDVSTAAIEKAKRTVDATFAILDIEKEYPSQKFDIIMCSDVLEHVTDDVSAINNIYQVASKYALVASVQGRMREFEKSIGHVRSYAYHELKEKLESAGFKTLSFVEWGFPLYSPLYRNLFNFQPVEKVSHGKYGFLKKMLCNFLYLIFFLNRHDKGDVIFILVRK
jgi:trans-aconitate methyltransferase